MPPHPSWPERGSAPHWGAGGGCAARVHAWAGPHADAEGGPSVLHLRGDPLTFGGFLGEKGAAEEELVGYLFVDVLDEPTAGEAIAVEAVGRLGSFLG